MEHMSLGMILALAIFVPLVFHGWIPAVIGAVGSLAGGVASGLFNKSSARDQNEAARETMEDQAIRNEEMYRQRYRWTTFDMREAGLNPILAASGGFSVGSGPSVGLPSMAQAQPMSIPDMSSSAYSMAKADKVQDEKKELASRTVKQGNEAAESVERAVTQRKQQNLLTVQEAKTAEEVVRTIQEVNKVTEEINVLKWKAAEAESNIQTQGVERSYMGAHMEGIDAQIRHLNQQVNNLKLLVPELERTADVYKGPVGKIVKYAEEVLHAVGPGVSGGLVGGMFGSYMRMRPRGKSKWSTLD